MANLAINEEFYSIQGEGIHTGVPMYFIRLQGCDVGCYFCDTKYTWRDKLPQANIEDIATRAVNSKAKWVCITGGEPYEQDLKPIVDLLHFLGLKVHVETSGEIYQDVDIDWVCLSPKDLFARTRSNKCDEHMKHRADEFKCVVTKPEDIDYYVKWYYPFCTTYNKPFILQPVTDEMGQVQPGLVETILKSITNKNLVMTRVMIQTHKYMGMR